MFKRKQDKDKDKDDIEWNDDRYEPFSYQSTAKYPTLSLKYHPPNGKFFAFFCVLSLFCHQNNMPLFFCHRLTVL